MMGGWRMTESGLKDFALSHAGASPTKLNDVLTEAILSAANKAIPKGCGRPSPKAWWTPEVAAAVTLRAQARRASGTRPRRRRRARARARRAGSGRFRNHYRRWWPDRV